MVVGAASLAKMSAVPARLVVAAWTQTREIQSISVLSREPDEVVQLNIDFSPEPLPAPGQQATLHVGAYCLGRYSETLRSLRAGDLYPDASPFY